MPNNEQIVLASTSPLSFEVVKVGDRLRVIYSAPKPNECRAKIGKSMGGFLLFCGQTKVGMIPRKISDASAPTLHSAISATVVVVDPVKKKLIVTID
jgi:hypothetical protein